MVRKGSRAVEKDVIGAITKTCRGWLFCLAFVAIGLESNFRQLAHQMTGGKPIVLYMVGQSFNLILTLIAAYLAFGGWLLDAVALRVEGTTGCQTSGRPAATPDVLLQGCSSSAGSLLLGGAVVTLMQGYTPRPGR